MITEELKQMKLSELIEMKQRILKQVIKLSKQIAEVSKNDLKEQYSNTYRLSHNTKVIQSYIDDIMIIDDAIQYICEY
jgi:flagellar biosynthesis/type III secretory pathway chaperone